MLFFDSKAFANTGRDPSGSASDTTPPGSISNAGSTARFLPRATGTAPVPGPDQQRADTRNSTTIELGACKEVKCIDQVPHPSDRPTLWASPLGTCEPKANAGPLCDGTGDFVPTRRWRHSLFEDEQARLPGPRHSPWQQHYAGFTAVAGEGLPAWTGARGIPRVRTGSRNYTRRSKPASAPPTYTVGQCVKDWLESIERDPHTMETIIGQAKNWIYPKIGTRKLRDFTATEADNFFRGTQPGAQQANAHDDQEHASPLDPASASSQPHQQKRRRAYRPPSGPARPPIPRNDSRPSRQGPQDRAW